MNILVGKHYRENEIAVMTAPHWPLVKRYCRTRFATVLALVVGVALVAKTASAQEIPREGPFTVNFTSIGIDPIPPVAIADDREMGIASSVMTTTNASGRGLLHNLTGRCLGWYMVDKTSASYEYHGHCNYTDGNGDIIFEKADFDFQPLATVRVGTGKWLGGTGKYSGLTGVFEIRVRPLKPAKTGIVQAIGTKEGRYRLPAPTAAQ